MGANKFHTVLSPDLRALYRRVAKLVYPDFATDELDRDRRERFMKEANAACRRSDLGALNNILQEWE